MNIKWFMMAWGNILASVAWHCSALVCHCSSMNTGACVIDLRGSSVVLMLVGILNTGLWNVQLSCTVQSMLLRHRGSCLIYLLWLCSVHRNSQVENTFLLAKNVRTWRSKLSLCCIDAVLKFVQFLCSVTFSQHWCFPLLFLCIFSWDKVVCQTLSWCFVTQFQANIFNIKVIYIS